MDGAEARDPYPAVGARARPDDGRRAAVAAKPGARARAERPPVQILVVVANIQMRTLKAEEGKAGGRVQRPEEHRTSRGVRCAPAAPENPEDRVPPTPGRTHNRIRSPR
ncbi:hypothetical protein E2542_SST30075 [Spatholobus suberectus]|nr:hypothetical protein E2542_SST30075 [Spatholobus suberectus]